MGSIGGQKASDAGARLALAAVLVLISGLVVPVGTEPAAALLSAAIYGCAGILATLLFLVRCDDARPERSLFEAAVATLLVGLIVLADPVTRSLAGVLDGYLLAVFLLCATAATAARTISVGKLITVFAALTLAPVWAGPLVELAGNPGWLRGLVIGASPLTALSVAIELDYLRTPWFYAHSALGSMRYDYPTWLTILACLSVLPAAVLVRRVVAAGAQPFVRFPREAHS
ncbi:hypothetical protein [Lentisalinibacter salinarum]|uniref:hypothetical protein n=1 Tax=Lentisalinibacter salinarum TaxID=2992239 RepID=UPI0038673542